MIYIINSFYIEIYNIIYNFSSGKVKHKLRVTSYGFKSGVRRLKTGVGKIKSTS